MKQFKVAMVVQALDKFTSPMRAMGKAVGSMTDRAEQGLNSMADGAIESRAKLASLTRPLTQIARGLNRVSKNTGLNKLARQAHGAAGALGTVATRATAASAVLGGLAWGGDAIAKASAKHQAMAKALGISARELENYGAMVKGVGFEAENIADMIEEMNNKFGESKGLGEITPVTEAKDILGLNVEDLNSLNIGEQFKKVISAALDMEDHQKAVSALDILMGGESNKIVGHFLSMMKETGKSFEELYAGYDALNLATKEGLAGNKKWAAASFDLFHMLKSGVTELVGILGNELAPFVEELLPAIKEHFGSIREKAKDFAKGLPGTLKSLAKGFKSAWKESAGFRKGLMDVINWIGPGKALFGSLAAIIAGPLITSLVAMTATLVTMGVSIGATPIGWFIGIVAVLVGLAVLIVKNWGPVSGFFKKMWQDIKAAFDKGFIHGVLHVLKIFSPVWLMQKAVEKLAAWLKTTDLYKKGVEWITGFVQGIKDRFNQGISWLKEHVNGLLDIIPDWALPEGIKGQLKFETEQHTRFTSALPEGNQKMRGEIRIVADNLPPGMKIEQVQSDNMDVDIDAGYNMLGAH